MFIQAIADEQIDNNHFLLEKGSIIYGNVRSYNQDFMNDTEIVDVEEIVDEYGFTIDTILVYKPIRFKIKKGSIKSLFCGCGKRAIRYKHDVLCDECEYEKPENLSYLSQTPWSFY
jgi:hypothetical protein